MSNPKLEYLAKKGILGLDAFDQASVDPQGLMDMFPHAYTPEPELGTMVAVDKVRSDPASENLAQKNMKAVADYNKDMTVEKKLQESLTTAKDSLRNLFSSEAPKK